MPSNRAGGNGHKVKHKRVPLNIRKHFSFFVCTVTVTNFSIILKYTYMNLLKSKIFHLGFYKNLFFFFFPEYTLCCFSDMVVADSLPFLIAEMLKFPLGGVNFGYKLAT